MPEESHCEKAGSLSETGVVTGLADPVPFPLPYFPSVSRSTPVTIRQSSSDCSFV